MKKIFILMMAAVLSVSSVFSAMAYNSSPHIVPSGGGSSVITNDSDKTVVFYKDDTKTSLSGTTEKYVPSYLDQLEKQYPADGTAAKARAAAGQLGIQIMEGKRKDGIDDVLIYTEYPERQTIIASESRSDIAAAYAEAEAVDEHMEKYVPAVADKAKAAGYAPEDCYVAQIFDLTYYLIIPEYVYSQDYKGFKVCLSRPQFKDNFICLLHRYNGTWQMLDTTWEGDNVTFYVKALSPFAIICAGDGSIMDSDSKQGPKTGDNTLLWGACAAGMVSMLMCAGYILLRRKKNEQ